jgi:hypothetical protein
VKELSSPRSPRCSYWRVEAIAVQLRNTVAFLSSTSMFRPDTITTFHTFAHTSTRLQSRSVTSTPSRALLMPLLGSHRIFTGINAAFMLLKLRSVPIHCVLTVRPNIQLSDGTSATCKPIDKQQGATRTRHTRGERAW